MSLVGKKAPAFNASAVINGNQIVDNYSLESLKGKYVLLFFYPLDFTFVCPTELHAFQEKLSAFESRNTQVIGCSIDSAYSHFAWLNTPAEKGGIQGVTYPLIADLTKQIATDYEVLKEDAGIAFRGLFLMDTEGTVRHQLINDLPLGRNVDEAIRVIDALQFHEENGEVCPANWNKGDRAIKTEQESVGAYLQDIKVVQKA